jgi:CubicO group peptidase (beta-lactamase class C family)
MVASDDNSAIYARLKAHQLTIEKITKIAGVAGASIGVIHGGEVMYTNYFGFKDVSKKEIPDSDTLYGIGSCSNRILQPLQVLSLRKAN